MTGTRRIAATALVGVLLVVVSGVAGHELGLRGANAFALPLVVGVVYGAGTLVTVRENED